MKTVNANVKGMSFGFGAVNAGQRNTVVAPQLIATSTEGGFRLTGPATRVLGIAHGDYAMFVNNMGGINEAINAKAPELVAFCEEQGLEWGSAAATEAIYAEFTVWAVAKGIQLKDGKGNVRTVAERLTKKDKATYVNQNFAEMLEGALNSGNKEIVAALTREGITEDEQKDILVEFVQGRELPKYEGSKVANPAGLTGAGANVTFTDANVWHQMKSDLEDGTKVNRAFELDIENVQTVDVSNGYETVSVPALILGESSDAAPARIGSKEEAAE